MYGRAHNIYLEAPKNSYLSFGKCFFLEWHAEKGEKCWHHLKIVHSTPDVKKIAPPNLAKSPAKNYCVHQVYVMVKTEQEKGGEFVQKRAGFLPINQSVHY